MVCNIGVPRGGAIGQLPSLWKFIAQWFFEMIQMAQCWEICLTSTDRNLVARYSRKLSYLLLFSRNIPIKNNRVSKCLLSIHRQYFSKFSLRDQVSWVTLWLTWSSHIDFLNDLWFHFSEWDWTRERLTLYENWCSTFRVGMHRFWF